MITLNTLLVILVISLFLVVPSLLSFFLTYKVMRFFSGGELASEKTSIKDKVNYIFSLHPEKGLSSQSLFWISIITPFNYFLFLGLLAWKDYVLRLDAEGFKVFISISALPLGVLALALPLSVSVARFHSSKQTAKQIAIVSQKNNLDLYNSHRKELFGYFQQLGEVKYTEKLIVKNRVHPRVYKNFFYGVPSEGIPNPQNGVFENIDIRLTGVRKNLVRIIKSNNPEEVCKLYLLDFGVAILDLSNRLGIPEINDMMESSPSVPYSIAGNSYHFETVGTTSDDAIAAFRAIENFFHNLCDFANYESQYFMDFTKREEFDEVLRINGKTKLQERVIERLHENQIKKAISS